MGWNKMKKQFDKSLDKCSVLFNTEHLSEEDCNLALQLLHESSKRCRETALFLKQDNCSYVKSGTLVR